MKVVFLLWILASGWGGLHAEDSPPIGITTSSGCTVTRRYAMISQGSYLLPGIQKFYVQRSGDPKSILCFASPRPCQFRILCRGNELLIQETLAPLIYRLLLVEVARASEEGEAQKLGELSRLRPFSPFGLSWISDLGAKAYEAMMKTHPSPYLILHPRVVEIAADGKKYLLTFNRGPILGPPASAKKVAKTFHRRYFEVDRRGQLIREFRRRPIFGKAWG